MPYSINLNIDLSPLYHSHKSHQSHSQTSRLLTSSTFLGCLSPPRNPVYPRRVDPSVLTFCLSQSESHYTNTHVHVFPLTLSLLINNNHLSKEEEKRGRTKELNSWRTSKEIQTHLDWLFPLSQRLLVGIPGDLCLGLENNQMLHKVQVEQPLAQLFFCLFL